VVDGSVTAASLVLAGEPAAGGLVLAATTGFVLGLLLFALGFASLGFVG